MASKSDPNKFYWENYCKGVWLKCEAANTRSQTLLDNLVKSNAANNQRQQASEPDVKQRALERLQADLRASKNKW